MSVLLYGRVDFGGAPVAAPAGNYRDIRALGFPNDDLTGIKIPAFMVVALYNSYDFNSTPKELRGPLEIPRLNAYGLNDNVSSLKIAHTTATRQEIVNCCTGRTAPGNCGMYADPANCRKLLGSICANSSGLGLPECRDWCSYMADQGLGDCDAAVLNWCEEQTDDPFCNCVNSPALTVQNDDGRTINPACVDGKCILTGYKTQNMRALACPDQVNCNVYANLVNSGTSLSQSVKATQNCGNKPVTTAPPLPIPGSGSGPVAAAQERNWYVLIIAIILVLLLGAGAAWLFLSGGHDTQNLVGAPLAKRGV